MSSDPTPGRSPLEHLQQAALELIAAARAALNAAEDVARDPARLEEAASAVTGVVRTVAGAVADLGATAAARGRSELHGDAAGPGDGGDGGDGDDDGGLERIEVR